MPQPIEIGKSFLDEVFKLIPADQQEAARAAYSRAQDTFQTAMQEVEAPLSHQKSELEKWHRNLQTWAEGKEAQYAERERQLAARGNGNPNPNPNPNPSPNANPPHMASQTQTFTLDEVTKLVNERIQETVTQMGGAIALSQSDALKARDRHFALYGTSQPFDLEALYRHPKVREVGLLGAYEDLHKDTIAAKAAEAAAAREAEIRANERQKVLAEIGTNKTLPFPTAGEDDSPFGILARRTEGQQTEEYGAAAATRYFNEIRAQRSA